MSALWYLVVCLLIYSCWNIHRNEDDSSKNKRKPLQPGKVSPRLPVPDHILKPPYVNSKQPPGIASGPELHDEKGIECMRASGRLAAQVLEYAGTLVNVSWFVSPITWVYDMFLACNWLFASLKIIRCTSSHKPLKKSILPNEILIGSSLQVHIETVCLLVFQNIQINVILLHLFTP